MSRVEPGLPGAVVRASRETYMHGSVPSRQVSLTLTPEQYEQYRTGHRCPKCHTFQDEAFPLVCKTVWKDTGERCGFRIRDDLEKWLNQEYRGEESLWPDRTDAIGSEREREEWMARTGIWVP